jgi:hypothetical protein
VESQVTFLKQCLGIGRKAILNIRSANTLDSELDLKSSVSLGVMSETTPLQVKFESKEVQ